jgi:hypothetical protein
VNTYAKIVLGAFTRFVVEFRGFYSRISYSEVLPQEGKGKNVRFLERGL